MALISLRDVCMQYGGPAVLDAVSFSIEPGDRACITGRNGEEIGRASCRERV